MNDPSVGSEAEPRRSQWSDRLGQWNPQLLRELRGMNRKLMGVAAAVSFLASLLLVCTVSLQALEPALKTSAYGSILSLSRMMWMLVLAVAGASLAKNWEKEARLGTLTFLRLSPEPAGRILLGKLLGVPAPFFAAAVAWLPFHLFLTVKAGFSSMDWLVADGFSVALAGMTLTGFLTLSTLTERMNSVVGVVMAIALIPLIFSVFFGIALGDGGEVYPNGLRWFGVDLVHSSNRLLIWGTGVVLAVTASLWQVAKRRFTLPHGTPLARRHAYQFMGLFNILFLGFGLPITDVSNWGVYGWAHLGQFWLLLQGLLLWGTMPNRQQLLDWARYRHFHRHVHPQSGDRPPTASPTGPTRQSPWHRLHPWIWHSGSPPFAVPLVNLAITVLIWSPWAIALGIAGNPIGLGTLVGWVSPTATFVAFAAFGVWLLLRHPRVCKGVLTGIVGIYGCLILGAPAIGLFLVGWMGLASLAAAVGMVAIAQRTLQQMGASESQLLLNASSSSP